MKGTILFYTILSAMILAAASCKKEQIANQEIKPDTCVAGTPGNLTIKVTLQHHEHTLINLKNYRDTIYVKYNVQEFQGFDPAAYDTIYIGEYPEDNVRLTNLKCGKYYIFAVGMESTHFDRVYGGIPYSTEMKEGEVSVTIPVTN
ncbi:MAG TPA: hypothetical protein VJY62_11725 [Bacteroidia bacterium]|nr:hypothetical protein [Bacteroidia bacterium]